MKTTRRFVLLIMLLSLITLSSHTPERSAQSPIPKINTVALISVRIIPFSKPLFPLINASSFNEKVNLLAGPIMDEEKKRVDGYRQILAENIGKTFQVSVIYGQDLQSNDKFPELYNQYNDTASLKTNDKYFPYRLISGGDINTIQIIFGKKNQDYKEMVIEMCARLGTDAVAFSYANLYVYEAQMGKSPLELNSSLYLIDKEGVLIAEGSGKSNETLVKGKDLRDFTMKLDEYDYTCEIMVQKTASDYLKKMKKR